VEGVEWEFSLAKERMREKQSAIVIELSAMHWDSQGRGIVFVAFARS
jgi:hypothetical protein